MARTFYTSTTASDLSTGGDFSNALADAQEAASSITLTAAASGTAAGSYFTAPDVPGTGGTSTGTFTIRTNITTAQAGVNFRANLMRVNSAGTVQTTVLGTYAAASAGVRIQTYTDPALGTWATGDRLRVQYQIQNTNTMGGSKGITFETGQLAQDTPFTTPSQAVALAGASTAGSGSTALLSAMVGLQATSGGTSTSDSSLTVTAGGAAVSLAGASAGSSSSASNLTVTAGGTAVALAGNSAGASASDAVLSASVSLLGSSAGASASDAIMSAAIPLAGLSGGTSDSVGTPTLAIGLSGTSAGTGNSDGHLAVVGDTTLTGLSAGAATSSGGLSLLQGLIGQSAGTSTTVGSITIAGALDLVGASLGMSGAVGTLSADVALSGSSLGSSTSVAGSTPSAPIVGGPAPRIVRVTSPSVSVIRGG